MRIVETYSKLEKYVEAFIHKETELVVIYGQGGIGKSHTVNKVCDGKAIVIGGHLTPMKHYEMLRDNPDKSIVYRDIDGLLHNRTNIALLKQVCEDKSPKTVSYTSSARGIIEENSTFETNTNVLIETNEYTNETKSLQPLFSRGEFIAFIPKAEEIIIQMDNVAGDDEVKKKVVEYAKKLHEEYEIIISMRLFIKATKWATRQPEKEWQEEIKESLFDEDKWAYMVYLNKTGATTKGQYDAFKARHPCSERAFFDYRKTVLGGRDKKKPRTILDGYLERKRLKMEGRLQTDML